MTAPADWYPDPLGRYEHRYWDGTSWTAHVATAGETAHDPIEEAAPQAGEVDGGTSTSPGDASAGASSQPPAGSPAPGPGTGPPGPAAAPETSAPPGGSTPPGGTTAPQAQPGAVPGAAGTTPGGGSSTNGKALASLLISILLGWIPILGGGIAIVLGFMARREISDSGGAQAGDGMAIAGIVLGILGILAWIGIILLIIVGVSMSVPFLNELERQLQEIEQLEITEFPQSQSMALLPAAVRTRLPV